VPGGQNIYASQYDGSINYTIPHASLFSSEYFGCPFEHYQGDHYGILTSRMPNAAGLMACPIGEEWKVSFALTNGTVPGECLLFEALTLPADRGAVWEYL
jgi:hypothetical protein